MAEPRLIAAYLTELRYSAARLADIDDVLAEAEDHLLAGVEAAMARGSSPADAEAEALARFGSAPLVARVFIEEEKRGGAVSTRFTRRAGLAAMLAPVLMIIGAFGNEAVPASEGALHGVFVMLLVAAFGAFTVAMWGLRQRHGGLGGFGRAALWLFVASPVIAAPFMWGAAVAFAFVQLVVVALLGIGMIRARILPVSAVGLFTIAPVVTIVAAAALDAAGVGDALAVPVGATGFATGLAWVGWAMWREPALDVPGRPGPGPLATT